MKALIYSRVSTEDQDNARQIAELRDYAKYKQFTVSKIFEEKITGASKAADRQEFKKLLDFVNKEKVDHILVWELSRLGRSMLDVLNTIETMSSKGINIFIKKENMNTLDDKGKKSTMTTMLISILSGFAEMERDTIRQRSISGIRASVAKGGSGTGIVMAYGYKKVDKKLVVDTEEAEVVKMIFNKYLSGLGTQQIAKHLNNEQIPTRFNKVFGEKKLKQKHGILKKGSSYTWKDGTIYRILTNPIYIGERRHKGEIFKIEPIVDKTIFNRVQTRLTENYNKKGNHTKFLNPLSDLLICGKCGRSYFMHKRTNGKDNAYKCISKRYNEYCGNPSINIDKLLDALYITCQQMIHSDAIDKNAQKKNVDNSIDNKEIQLTNAQTQVDELNSKQTKLVRLNLDGEITKKDYTTYRNEITADLLKAEEKVRMLTEELARLKSIANKSLPKAEDYSRTVFNDYIKDAIEYVKVYPVNNMKAFSSVFTTPKDVAVLIEVKSSLVWIDDTPIVKHFVISQRSKDICYISFNKDNGDYIDQINKGKYQLEFNHPLKDFPVPQIKNNYIKKEGTNPTIPKYNAPVRTKATKTIKLK